jgi:hypothetical protein
MLTRTLRNKNYNFKNSNEEDDLLIHHDHGLEPELTNEGCNPACPLGPKGRE